MTQEMSVTEKLIRDLKRTMNPATGEQWSYSEIAAVLKISKQGAIQHIRDRTGQCTGCLRRLRRRRKIKP